jgi:hypothetical protein
MSTNGASPKAMRDRRTSYLVALAIVVALIVFLGGYLLGRGPDRATTSDTAASAFPSPSETASPEPSASASASPEPTASPGTTEPGGDKLPDDTYFVQLSDLQGGEEGPPVIGYDLAYFLTGEQADQEAAARGMETPVPDGYFIVNDNHKLRMAPLADTFSVKYIPEGSGASTPVKAHAAQFLGWLGGSVQTDFPSKDTSWWWITIADGEVTLVQQQFLP